MARYRYTSDTNLVFLDLPDGCRILAPGDEVDLPKGHPYTHHAWLEPVPTKPTPTRTRTTNTPKES